MRWPSSPAPVRGRCATRCRFLDQAIAHGAIDVESIGALFGGSSFDGRLAVLRAVADEDVAGALVALGEQLDAGHEPRRLTEDLLATVRDAFLLTSARGRVRVDAPEDALAALGELGDQVGAPMLVRMLETLGQAVVDMRGTDAADPRLVVEIALVRLARREAGTPLQALAERIDRLERGGVVAAPPTPAVTAGAVGRASSGSRASGRGRSFAELRRDRETATPTRARGAHAGRARARTGGPDRGPAAAPVGEVDIDDVIVAWAEIQTGLPPATRAAVSAAQPLSVEGGVITFGVPRAQYDVAVPRFKKEADNIRAALSRLLGRQMQFKPVPHDGFDADPAASSAPPDDEPPRRRRDRSCRPGRREQRGPGGRFGDAHHAEPRRHRRRGSTPRLRPPRLRRGTRWRRARVADLRCPVVAGAR